jgi:hypothetical protein
MSKDNFFIEHKKICSLYMRNSLSKRQAQIYLNKYNYLFDQYKINIYNINIVDSDLKIKQLISASTLLKYKISLSK